jgi:outer membrane immunogenic protein
MKKLLMALLIPSFAFAANTATTDADFDSLGGNKVILDRAKALAPEQNVSIVQNRIVSRTKRFEISPEFSGSFGGDSYVKSKAAAVNLNFHINPRYSVGFKYENYFNELTPEGNSVIDKAIAAHEANPTKAEIPYPKLNYAKSGMMLTGNWYPLYGKLNLMDKAVTQFDVYLLAGLGQITLDTGFGSSRIFQQELKCAIKITKLNILKKTKVWI